jgi:hypothetical protein
MRTELDGSVADYKPNGPRFPPRYQFIALS